MFEKLYEEILQLPIPDDFGTHEDYDELTADTEEYVNEIKYNAQKFYGIKVVDSYGVSQLCLLFDNEDEVMKIGFKGSVCSTCDPKDPDDNSQNEWYDVFEPFRVDYSTLTKEVYDKAVDAGVEEFFAKIEELGKAPTGEPIYIQTYVKPYSHFTKDERESKASINSLKRTKELRREYRLKERIPFEDDWIAAFLEQYGEKRFIEFMNFIHDNDLGDFHSDNYGYTKEGKVCLLDYCGFGDW